MAQLLNNIYSHQSQLKKLLDAKKNKHLPHALLFTGPSGIGRRKVAWALAQSLLCEKQHPACGECSSCMNVEQEKSQHILFIQPDGLYIKVDSIRPISRFLALQSFAPARVIIIDSAHQMNLQAANSLLKILEEPPENVYFILISSHLSALPVTIRSRVQMLRFLPLNVKDLHMIMQISQREKQKKIKGGEEKESQLADLDWLIRASQGSMDNLEKWRENKSIRDQAFDLLKRAVWGEESYSFGELADLVKNRDQALFVCLCWQQILRDACMIKLNSEDTIIHRDQNDILNLLKTVSFENLNMFFQKSMELEQDLKGYLDSVLAFDNMFFQLGQMQKKGSNELEKRG